MGRKRASSDGPDNYEADGGFVVNSDHEGGSLPVSKRAKSEKKTKLSKAKGGLDDLEGGAKRDGDDVYWEISASRRVVISEFKGKKMINIREYYLKNDTGEWLPGKKGISLTLEQYSQLVNILPSVEALLAKSGVKVPRPFYDEVQKDEDNEESEEDRPSKKARSKAERKRNIEATSDEDEED
ncbi:MAG: hypothetical protein M1824_004419 [Vezdaea acicularis]|nr:MAG: hypothetical protein M1824_004419 [Vezdaea acicularis]